VRSRGQWRIAGSHRDGRTPDTRAPSASLFNVNPNGGHYLVETDPRFTDHKTG
jgi:hypothetical protein